MKTTLVAVDVSASLGVDLGKRKVAVTVAVVAIADDTNEESRLELLRALVLNILLNPKLGRELVNDATQFVAVEISGRRLVFVVVEGPKRENGEHVTAILSRWEYGLAGKNFELDVREQKFSEAAYLQ